jgi:peroxin-10
MFTRRLFPGEQRPGYELLGLLLLLQLLTQSYLSLSPSPPTNPTTHRLNTTLSPTSPHATPTGNPLPRPPQMDPNIPLDTAGRSHDPVSDTSETGDMHTLGQGATEVTGVTGVTGVLLDLEDENVCAYIPAGSRRCPLCLEAMKDPTAAECGHLFCWDCVLRWTGESGGRGECPICRGRCGREGLLRLAG